MYTPISKAVRAVILDSGSGHLEKHQGKEVTLLFARRETDGRKVFFLSWPNRPEPFYCSSDIFGPVTVSVFNPAAIGVCTIGGYRKTTHLLVEGEDAERALGCKLEKVIPDKSW